MKKINRNDFCPCGSGKKYKRCCLLRDKIPAENTLLANKPIPKASHATQFLLIRAWGAGFWADMHHVLGLLAIAEIKNLIPIVYWGEEFLYNTIPKSNAWDNFFEPLSEFSIQDIMNPRYSFYPPKWNHENLTDREINKYSGVYSRTSGLELIGRKEKVLVADFFTFISDIKVSVKHSAHPLASLPAEEIYREVHDRYVKLKPHIRLEIDEYAAKEFFNAPMIGVHYRSKSKEKLSEVGGQFHDAESYFREIDAILAQVGDAGIFLLTDTSEAVEIFRNKYGGKIISRDIARVQRDDNTELHYTDTDRYQQAKNVIIDVYLAIRCNFFIGDGTSNVSCAVSHLKEWNGKIKLHGQNIVTVSNRKNWLFP